MKTSISICLGQRNKHDLNMTMLMYPKRAIHKHLLVKRAILPSFSLIFIIRKIQLKQKCYTLQLSDQFKHEDDSGFSPIDDGYYAHNTTLNTNVTIVTQ